MPKRTPSKTKTPLVDWLRDSDSHGRQSAYHPWHRVQDVPSQGLSTRLKGWKTGRTHHFLSELERKYFLVLEWSPIITDVREQFPLLPLQETLTLAETGGFKHPMIPGTADFHVLTSDFVITVQRNGALVEVARTVKYAADLQSDRKIEKLEIERKYWTSRGVDWGIVTEREIPEALVKNVDWVHPWHDFNDLPVIVQLNLPRIFSTLQASFRPGIALDDLSHQTDDVLGLPHGTTLTAFRHWVANRHIRIDMNRPIQVSAPLDRLNLEFDRLPQ